MTPGLALDSGEFIPASQLNQRIDMSLAEKFINMHKNGNVWITTIAAAKIVQTHPAPSQPIASGQEPVARVVTVDSGPNNNPVVTWLVGLTGIVPNLKNGDKLYTQPAPEQQPPSEDQIVAAARALNRQSSRECGINEQDSWNLYADEYLADAKAALEAAHGVKVKP